MQTWRAHLMPIGLVLLSAGCHGGPTFPSPRAWICNPTAATANDVIEMFRSPFDGAFRVGNFLDHDKPLLSDDTASGVLTLCGVVVRGPVEGHPGYDYAMPEGTPLRTVAAGNIFSAGLEPPSFCPGLNRTVQALVVQIEHTGPDGHRYVSVYGHLSRIDVSKDQLVADGDAIGLSGNTGCSGSPHLHFAVYRLMPNGIYALVDPYGWHASSEDPWQMDPRGAKSAWLWRPGQAPALDFR